MQTWPLCNGKCQKNFQRIVTWRWIYTNKKWNIQKKKLGNIATTRDDRMYPELSEGMMEQSRHFRSTSGHVSTILRGLERWRGVFHFLSQEQPFTSASPPPFGRGAQQKGASRKKMPDASDSLGESNLISGQEWINKQCSLLSRGLSLAALQKSRFCHDKGGIL